MEEGGSEEAYLGSNQKSVIEIINVCQGPKYVPTVELNCCDAFEPSVVFHIENSHLFCTTNQVHAFFISNAYF